MVIENTDPFAPPSQPDRALIKAIVKAHRFNEMLLSGGVGKFADLARSENLHRSYYSQVLRFAYLAPDIERALEESAARADELASAGDYDGADTWRRITAAVEQLANTVPPGPLH